MRVPGAILIGLLLAAKGAFAGDMVPLTVKAGGSTYQFEVEIADDRAERAQGLMYREQLAQNAGMLFLYPDEKPRGFWMKNTPLPLDIIFIGGGGEVVHVAADARPFDESLIESYVPAQSVLEINGGLAAQLGIAPGAEISWPPQATAPQP